MSETFERIAPGLVGLLFWGAPTAWLGWQCWLARCSRHWPSTIGRVLSSSVQFDPHVLQRTEATARVHYEYHVHGRRLVGSRVRFGGWLNLNPRTAALTSNRYRVGTPVSVRFDPNRPHRCTLERRVSRLVWMFLAIGLFFTLSIAGALLGFWN